MLMMIMSRHIGYSEKKKATRGEREKNSFTFRHAAPLLSFHRRSVETEIHVDHNHLHVQSVFSCTVKSLGTGALKKKQKKNVAANKPVENIV